MSKRTRNGAGNEISLIYPACAASYRQHFPRTCPPPRCSQTANSAWPACTNAAKASLPVRKKPAAGAKRPNATLPEAIVRFSRHTVCRRGSDSR